MKDINELGACVLVPANRRYDFGCHGRRSCASCCASDCADSHSASGCAKNCVCTDGFCQRSRHCRVDTSQFAGLRRRHLGTSDHPDLGHSHHRLCSRSDLVAIAAWDRGGSSCYLQCTKLWRHYWNMARQQSRLLHCDTTITIMIIIFQQCMQIFARDFIQLSNSKMYTLTPTFIYLWKWQNYTIWTKTTPSPFLSILV